MVVQMKKDGFTLLEIMLVIAIMGIIIVVTAPNFSSTKDDFNLHSFARRCLSDLRYAQQLSIDTKEEHGVYFNTLGYEIRTSTGVVKSTDFTGGITYQEIEGTSINQIVFRTDGSPYTSGRIVLKSNTDIYAYINVTPSTGEVSLLWK